MSEIKINRCPLCGSANLKAVYNKSVDKQIFRRGLLGYLYHTIRNGRDARTLSYNWVCQSCGHVFQL